MNKENGKKKFRGPFKLQREGGWMLYFWHGMGLSTWIGLLRRGRFDVTVNCLPSIVTVSLWAPVNSALYYLSEALFGRRAERCVIEPAPIFVIGHWRAGTTLLHELLACDPAHGYPTTYQCFFPGHFLLTGGLVRGWFNIFLPKIRPMDRVPVGVDRPQEEEFALVNLGLGSPYVTLAWPRHGPRDMDYLDLSGLGAEAKRDWERGLLWFMKRLYYKQKKRLVLKSPAHTARIRTLIRLFPEARFVHISRHPLAIVPSGLRLWKALASVQGLHNPVGDEPWLREFVLSVFERVYRAYEADKGLIPPGHLVEIAFEDLVADPKRVMKDIYAKLNLGDFARAEPGIDAYLESRKDYQPNVFEVPEALRREILERWAGYIERFGYGEKVR